MRSLDRCPRLLAHDFHSLVLEGVYSPGDPRRPCRGFTTSRRPQMTTSRDIGACLTRSRTPSTCPDWIPGSGSSRRAGAHTVAPLPARFWELANDPEAARQRGIRALHGEAVSTRLRKDRIYTITLRSTGELTIQATP
jgi:hypothetical protein